MSRAGGGKLGQHVSWLWRAPLRALGAARDLYVRSLTGCAGHLPADAAFGYPTFAAAASSSVADEDEDLRELIRAASQRRAVEQERHPAAVPRSHSVAAATSAMARIDEDGPCDDFAFTSASASVVVAAAVFPRSRSCVPGRRGRVAALSA